jgi:hypothetical protein
MNWGVEGQGRMRGAIKFQPELVCLISPETVVPAAHPIRTIKARVDTVLRRMSAVFDRMYAGQGRPSIPPAGCPKRISAHG